MQKVRGHTYLCCASTAYRQLVSGSISLPSRGSFHLSLTVLVRIVTGKQIGRAHV